MDYLMFRADDLSMIVVSTWQRSAITSRIKRPGDNVVNKRELSLIVSRA